MPIMRATAPCIVAALLLHTVGAASLCPVGVYGPTCELTCGSHCTASKCEMDPDRGTFRCNEMCTDGWTGLTCNRKCARRCHSCDQTTGACAECLPDWCGEYCDQPCSESKGAGVPSKCLNANCTSCHDGWYGHGCGSPCPPNCGSGCDWTSGRCDHQCGQGYHGVLCNEPCTITCLDGCRQSDGSCIGGCESGWHGSHCNVSCNNTCIDNTCFQESGTCTQGQDLKVKVSPRCRLVWLDNRKVKSCAVGCEDGWRGDRCDQPCPEACHSCSRYPDARLCIYSSEVMKIRRHGVGSVDSMSFEIRLVYALLLVLFPVIIVGVVQVLRVCHERYKRRRGKKDEYEVRQPLSTL